MRGWRRAALLIWQTQLRKRIQPLPTNISCVEYKNQSFTCFLPHKSVCQPPQAWMSLRACEVTHDENATRNGESQIVIAKIGVLVVQQIHMWSRGWRFHLLTRHSFECIPVRLLRLITSSWFSKNSANTALMKGSTRPPYGMPTLLSQTWISWVLWCSDAKLLPSSIAVSTTFLQVLWIQESCAVGFEDYVLFVFCLLESAAIYSIKYLYGLSASNSLENSLSETRDSEKKRDDCSGRPWSKGNGTWNICSFCLQHHSAMRVSLCSCTRLICQITWIISKRLGSTVSFGILTKCVRILDVTTIT